MFIKTRVALSFSEDDPSLFRDLFALSSCSNNELRSDCTVSNTACLETSVSVSVRSLEE